MLKNYLTIALRTLVKQKAYGFICIVGLALGIASCVLILLFAENEWTHDRFHAQADHLFRVVKSGQEADGTRVFSGDLPAPLGPEVVDLFPEADRFVRFNGGQTRTLTYAGTPYEEPVHFADAALFGAFTFPLVQGDPATALARPDGAVVSRTLARKLFGGANPMGERLTVAFLDEAYDVTVTGVMRDTPANSSLRFSLVLPFEMSKYASSGVMRAQAMTSWQMPFTATFIRLADPEQAERLEARLSTLVDRHLAEAQDAPLFHLQPLVEIHHDPEVRSSQIIPGDPRYTYILAAIALLILLLACINFTTLSMGLSAGRAREVGIRKVVGAGQAQIRRQFWGEALLTSGLALVLGLALAELFLPTFNALAERELALSLSDHGPFLLAVLGLAVLTGLVAGSYPAVVLSRFTPSAVLRGGTRLGGQNRFTRALVVVQFSLSIALVICTLLMADQLDYLRVKDLGFDREQVVALRTPYGSSQEGARVYEVFRNELAGYDAVEDITSSFFVFGENGYGIRIEPGDTAPVEANMEVVDLNYPEAMGLELVAGRPFTEDLGEDREGSGVLVNEALARAYGSRPVLGETLNSRFYPGMVVVGVVKDFHFHSLHQPIAPMILAPRTFMAGSVRTILVRIKPTDLPATLALLEQTWKKAVPEAPFKYAFLDDIVDRQYRAEERWGRIVRYAAGFAVLIACFGLFGLAALSAAKRTKEVGIRKVLGASVSSIALLLSKDLVRLVAVAFVLAVPLAYAAISRWLGGFAYRIDPGPGTFAAAGLLVLVFAVGTVAYQSIRAARANPTKTLRYE